MSKYAYFPGCSADSTGISFTKSADYVTKRIGIELVEIPDWCCCGTSAALVTDGDLAMALPARSLALAEKMDASLDVATGCAGCFNSLKSARHYTVQSEANRAHVEELIEMPYSGNADVFSFLEIMARPDYKEAIKAALLTSLHGLKVACYYGCALVRPGEVCQFDDLEDPQSMDELMALAGAEPLDWGYKVECCGGSHNISEPKAAKQLTERIYEDAAINGAEAIVVACPLCFLNLDMRQKEINALRAKEGKSQFNIPSFYFTELLGLAMGGSHKELGINLHFWPAADTANASLRERKVVSEGEAKAAPIKKATAAPVAAPAAPPAAPPAAAPAAAPVATPVTAPTSTDQKEVVK